MSAIPQGQSRVKKFRVFIADDHPVVRRGLAQFLAGQPDMEVCGGADTVADALQQVESTCPDLLLVDIVLKDSHGIDLISQIKARHAHVKMLVWSMFDEKIYAERALRAGASGYINKQEPVENVVDAIRRVLGGEVYLSPQMATSLLRRLATPESLGEDPIRTLTDRELEIFRMIGRGLATRQIAGKLGLSPKTVEAHREKIKTKLNLQNAAQLTYRAVQWVLENG